MELALLPDFRFLLSLFFCDESCLVDKFLGHFIHKLVNGRIVSWLVLVFELAESMMRFLLLSRNLFDYIG